MLEHTLGIFHWLGSFFPQTYVFVFGLDVVASDTLGPCCQLCTLDKGHCALANCGYLQGMLCAMSSQKVSVFLIDRTDGNMATLSSLPQVKFSEMLPYYMVTALICTVLDVFNFHEP